MNQEERDEIFGMVKELVNSGGAPSDEWLDKLKEYIDQAASDAAYDAVRSGVKPHVLR